jgi:hypothetical protein
MLQCFCICLDEHEGLHGTKPIIESAACEISERTHRDLKEFSPQCRSLHYNLVDVRMDG